MLSLFGTSRFMRLWLTRPKWHADLEQQALSTQSGRKQLELSENERLIRKVRTRELEARVSSIFHPSSLCAHLKGLQKRSLRPVSRLCGLRALRIAFRRCSAHEAQQFGCKRWLRCSRTRGEPKRVLSPSITNSVCKIGPQTNGRLQARQRGLRLRRNRFFNYTYQCYLARFFCTRRLVPAPHANARHTHAPYP